jgi:tRNA1Val (adenine37-N6)-methyltransferase
VAGGIEDFAAAAERCLKYGGLFYTVYRPDRLESLFAALERHHLAPKRMVFVHDHPNKEPSMVLTEAKRGAGEGLTLLPPLLLHDLDENGTPLRHLSQKAQQIYDLCRFE